MNKEIALACLIGKNLGRWGRQNFMLRERRVESERRYRAATGDRSTETLLVGHDLVVIYRLIEMD